MHSTLSSEEKGKENTKTQIHTPCMVNQHCTYLCIIHISSTSTENDSDILFSMLQVESGPLKVEKEEDGGGGDGEDGEGGSEKVTEQWIEDKLGRFVHKPAESITQKLQVSREEIKELCIGFMV